jgi:hypothetical protein
MMFLPSLAMLPLDTKYPDTELRNKINNEVVLSLKLAHQKDSRFYYQIVYKGKLIGKMRWMPAVNNGVWSAALTAQREIQADGSERFNLYEGLGFGVVSGERLTFVLRFVTLLNDHGWSDVKEQIKFRGALDPEESA